MTDVWIVVVEDRHADVEVLPFSSESQALAVAHDEAAAGADDPTEVREGELSQRAIRDGWVLLLEYGAEGDQVRVVKRTMDRLP